MEFAVLGKYTLAGLTGFGRTRRRIEGRDRGDDGEGRRKMSGLWLTRGEYDAAVIGEAPDFETVAAIKMMVLASGAE